MKDDAVLVGITRDAIEKINAEYGLNIAQSDPAVAAAIRSIAYEYREVWEDWWIRQPENPKRPPAAQGTARREWWPKAEALLYPDSAQPDELEQALYDVRQQGYSRQAMEHAAHLLMRSGPQYEKVAAKVTSAAMRLSAPNARERAHLNAVAAIRRALRLRREIRLLPEAYNYGADSGAGLESWKEFWRYNYGRGRGNSGKGYKEGAEFSEKGDRNPGVKDDFPLDPLRVVYFGLKRLFTNHLRVKWTPRAAQGGKQAVPTTNHDADFLLFAARRFEPKYTVRNLASVLDGARRSAASTASRREKKKERAAKKRKSA